MLPQTSNKTIALAAIGFVMLAFGFRQYSDTGFAISHKVVDIKKGNGHTSVQEDVFLYAFGTREGVTLDLSIYEDSNQNEQFDQSDGFLKKIFITDQGPLDKWSVPKLIRFSLTETISESMIQGVYFLTISDRKNYQRLQVRYAEFKSYSGVSNRDRAFPAAVGAASADQVHDSSYEKLRSAINKGEKDYKDLEAIAVSRASLYFDRLAALEILREDHYQLAVKSLVAILNDPDDSREVRVKTAEILGEIGSDSAIRALINILARDYDDIFRARVASILADKR